MEGLEGFDSPSASPKLHDQQQVAVGRFPCNMPLACLTSPLFGVSDSIPNLQFKKPHKTASRIGGPGGIRTLDTRLKRPLL